MTKNEITETSGFCLGISYAAQESHIGFAVSEEFLEELGPISWFNTAKPAEIAIVSPSQALKMTKGMLNELEC